MLMVVFGAGASFDSYALQPPGNQPDVTWRPPLAVELFSRPELYANVEQFVECQPIVSRLAALPGGISVEEELERLRTEAEDGDSERTRQLVAVRYYLHYGILQHQNQWRSYTKGVSNYKALMDQIRAWRLRNNQAEPVCFVTFNYDTLFEEAVWQTLRLGPSESLKQYIATDYKIVKLHGSVDWGREVDTSIPEITDAVRRATELGVVRAIIRRAPELELTDRYRVVRALPMSFFSGPEGRITVVPAIAVPVQHKQAYECPEEHIGLLHAMLPDVNHVVMVGWRSREEQFVRRMVELLPKSVRTIVISRDLESGSEVKGFLEASGYPGSVAVAVGGFSGFVLHQQFDRFMSWTGEAELRLD